MRGKADDRHRGSWNCGKDSKLEQEYGRDEGWEGKNKKEGCREKHWQNHAK